MSKSYTTTLKDCGDGSGDCFVTIPQEILDGLGWVEGDVVELELTEEKTIIIRKKNNCLE